MAEYTPFLLERAFDEHESAENVPQMSCSDGEPMSQTDLLAMADDECRQLWQNLTLAYTQVGGHPLMLKELSNLYSNKCQILPAVPQECILLAMLALCDQIRADAAGDEEGQEFEAIVAWPTYQSLHETLRSQGVKLLKWNIMPASNTNWNFNLDDLKGLVSERTRLLVVNFPHNPSGFLPSPEAWTEVVSLCSENQIYLFSDEIYNASLRNRQQSDFFALNPAAKQYSRAVSMSGLSKCFGLPGLRLGWLASQNDQLMRRFRLLKDYTTICQPSPVEILGLIALRNAAKLTGRVREIVERNLQVAGAFFAKHCLLFRWRELVEGTTALVEMLDPLLDKFDGSGKVFCDTISEKFKIFVLSSSVFHFTDRYMRIGLGRRDLCHAFSSLETALRELELMIA